MLGFLRQLPSSIKPSFKPAASGQILHSVGTVRHESTSSAKASRTAPGWLQEYAFIFEHDELVCAHAYALRADVRSASVVKAKGAVLSRQPS
jgi:hypothetical protein